MDIFPKQTNAHSCITPSTPKILILMDRLPSNRKKDEKIDNSLQKYSAFYIFAFFLLPFYASSLSQNINQEKFWK